MKPCGFKASRMVLGLVAGLIITAGHLPGAWSAPPAAVELIPPVPRKANLYAGFQSLANSAAYRQYQHRPKSDLSKLLFLIDRFAQAKVEIIYDGFHFKTTQVVGMVRFFLSRNYNKQTPEQWIYQWCNTTVPRGKIILVKLPDGSTQLGREVLFGELAALEELEVASQGVLSVETP